MRRQSVIAAAAGFAVFSAGVATSAGAATHRKPKTKVKKGGYTVTAAPDPTMEATGLAGQECFNVDPASVDNHRLTLPGTGLLKVVLDSPDPTPGSKMDWDLHLLDAKGNIISSSNGPTSHEEIDQPGVSGKVTIRACNLMGEPTATVSWIFTYR